jgi:hypothetical protein
MAFESELTQVRAIQSKKDGQFHSRYEKAIEEQLKELKKPQTFQNIIAGKRGKVTKTFDKFSPTDKRLRLGKFQLGTRSDVNAEVWARCPLGLAASSEVSKRSSEPKMAILGSGRITPRRTRPLTR